MYQDLTCPSYCRSNKGRALFKRQQENSSTAPRSPLSKVASESDLTHSLNLPLVNGGKENDAAVVVGGDVEPISITVNATFAKQQQLETEGGSDSGSNKLVIDTSRDNSVVSGGIGVCAVDEVDNAAVKKSEPLLITTQPINDKASLSNVIFISQSGIYINISHISM